MLDRISNINTNEKYKSKLKVYANPYAILRHEDDKNSQKDTALFSALAKLMSKINWKILSVDLISKDEMFFNFLVNDFEFSTIVNLNEMYLESYQTYTIINSKNIGNQKIIDEVKLKSLKENLSILQYPKPISTDNIELLFNNINNYVRKNPSDKLSNSDMNKFQENIDHQINNELNYILRVIYTFISTRNKSRVKNNFILKTQEIIPIIMQKVNIIYA